MTASSISTSSTTPTLTPTDVTIVALDFINTPKSMASTTAAASKLYTLPDTSTGAYCMIPYTVSPSSITYDTNTNTPNSVDFGPITVQDCRGISYTVSAVTLSNGAALPTGILTFISGTKLLSVKITTAEFLNYVGTRNLMVTATFGGTTIYPLIQLTVLPLTAYVRNPEGT